MDVTVIGTPIEDTVNVKFGMLIDFGDLKELVKRKIVNPLDHATVLNCNSPHKKLADTMEAQGHKIYRVAYQPTCEMMIIDFANILLEQLPNNIALHHLKLRETATAFAEWYASDQTD